MNRFIFTISLIYCVTFPFVAISQTNESGFKTTYSLMPKSPEAASVIKFIDFPLGHYTGTPQINFPIAAFEEYENVSASVSLSYHASGNRVEDVPECVGLGWRLNAGGMVTRQVHGIPDDASHCMGFLTFRQSNTFASVQNDFNTGNVPKLEEYSMNIKDIEPDEFYFSFNGYDGKFAFDWTGALPVLSSSSPIKIVSFTQDPATNRITSWVLQDGFGVSYTFSAVETTTISSLTGGRLEGICNGPHAYASGWHLTKISSPITTYSIDFQYDDYSYTKTNYQLYETCSGPGPGGSASFCPNYYVPPGTNTCNSPSQAVSASTINGKRLKKIINATGKYEIEISAVTDRTDGPGSATNFKTVNSITNKIGGQLISRYNFSYFYQGNRLMLQSLEEEGINGEKIPKYTFTYNNGVLEPYDSRKIDFWGYQNNNTSGKLAPFFFTNVGGVVKFTPGADRNPALAGTKSQVLEKVTFPNGGNTEFIYEQNDCSYIGASMTVADKAQYTTTPFTDGVSAVGSVSTWTIVEKQVTINNYEALCNFYISGSTWAYYNASAYAPRAYLKNSAGTVIASWQLGIVQFGLCDPPCASSISDLRFLQPGTYTIGCQARKFPDSPPTNGNDFISLQMSFDQVQNAPAILKQAVGGLRVKEVRSFDPLNSQTIVKKYEYTDETLSGYSSGVIYSDPVNIYSRKFLYYPGPSSCTYGDCNYYDIVGSSRIAVGATAGSHIGYRRVVEIIGNAQEGGKAIYTFSSPKEYMDVLNTTKPFARPETQSYKTGLLTKKRLYDQNNALVYQEDKSYLFKDFSINVPKIGFGNYDRGSVSATSGTCADAYDLLPASEKFTAWWGFLKMGFAQLQSTVVRNYYGSNAVEKTTNLTYDPALQLLKSSTTIDYSIGYEWKQMITYPRDYACTTGCTTTDPAMQTILEMNARNMVNYPIEKTSWLKKPGFADFQLLSAQLLEYAGYGSFNNIQPRSLHQLFTAAPLSNFVASSRNGSNQLAKDSRYTKEYSYNFSSTNGRLLEQYREIVSGWDARDQYIWGHEFRLPTASVMNANTNEVAYTSFEEPATFIENNGGWTLTGAGGWSNAVGDFRTGRTGYNLSPAPRRCTANNLPAGKYLISFWHKNGTVTVNGTTVSTAGSTWTYAEKELTFTGTANTVIVASGSADWSQFIDELRLHPSDALMRTASYDNDKYLLLSMADESGTPMTYEYDNMRRLKATRNFDYNIRQTYEYNYAAPGTALNNVKSRNILTPTQDFATAIGLTGSNVIRNFSYFDGLGRLVQSNLIGQSPAGNDIISPAQYDVISRKTKAYIPYTITSNSGTYRTAAFTEQAAFANTFGAGGYGYGESAFDNSPLNRTTAQAAPGAAWNMATGAKNTYVYRSNSAADAVRNLFGSTTYNADALDVVEETDENGKKRLTFSDKMGRVVLVKQQIPATLSGNADSDWACTYTAYDDFGRVAAVMPPETSKKMKTSGSWDYTLSTYASMVYRYVYDARGRMTSKTVPSGGTTVIAYDRLDRPVLTTDANGFKQFTRYDQLNRPVVTGKYKGAASPGTSDPLFETPNTIAPHYYTATSFPTDNNIDVYKVFYYDDYDLDNNGTLGTGETYTNPAESPYTTTAVLTQRGKPTAGKTAILKNDGTAPTVYLMSRTYRDREMNAIQINKQNHLGGADITSSAYDFANRLTNSRRDHTATPPGGTLKTHTIREEYIYDHASRIRFVRHKINANNWAVTSAPLYDELGRLNDKRLHASNYDGVSAVTLASAFNYLQSLDYQYNIRDWLTGINDVASCAVQAGDNLADVFSLKLDYNAPTGGGTAQYNGNISTMQWRTYIGTTCLAQQQYRFTYDAANRLKAADHYTNPAGSWVFTNNYTESNINYDLNGNLMSYTRRGNISGTTFGVIDQLTYTYGDAARPDRLTQVTEAGVLSKGFITSTATASYQYDNNATTGNGNMTQDNHKGFAIQYNFLNLPVVFTKGANVITMTYTADGEKLTKAVTGGGATKNYIAGIEYSGANLEAIYHSEGRCTPNGATAFYYEYTVKDHLGNARVNFRANGAAIVFLEELHYYPFGMQMEGIGTAASTQNGYKYNSKELNNDFGLGLYDYGARWYDAALGRWWAVDPLAEKYKQWSGYNYGVDNPVLFVDPDGMSTETVNPIGRRATAAYNEIKENASPERKAELQKLEDSSVTYNIEFRMAESMPGNSLSFTTGSVSADGKEAVVSIVIGDNDDAMNIAMLGDELAHASQFENNELAIGVNSQGKSGMLAYDQFDEAKSKDASVEASRSTGNELNDEQKDWVNAKANGTTQQYFESHGYQFNGVNGSKKPTSGREASPTPNESNQALSNRSGYTIINRENGKTNISRPQ